MDFELTNKITPVIPAIEFECVVAGKELTATVTYVEESIIETAYHVCFSDGHEAVYVPGDDGHNEEFGRTRELDEYEEAVWDDLCVIPGLEEGGRYTYIRVQVRLDGNAFNVWVRPDREQRRYDVYYKGGYHFTLRKNEGWERSTIREKGYVIDSQLACLICKHLDLYEL